MTVYVGVDPGPVNGAFVVLDGDALGACVAWDRKRVIAWTIDGGAWVVDLSPRTVLAGALAAEGHAICAVERVHCGRVRGRQVVDLAEDAGAWCEVVRSATGQAPHRVLAADWRRHLGIGVNVPAATCDVMARALLVERFGFAALADASVPGHVVDAVGIAVWARDVAGTNGGGL